MGCLCFGLLAYLCCIVLLVVVYLKFGTVIFGRFIGFEFVFTLKFVGVIGFVCLGLFTDFALIAILFVYLLLIFVYLLGLR